MRSLYSNLLTSVMVLMMAATSGAAASARGHMAQVAMNIVICDGDGLRTILVGADGRDIGASHICVDCDQSTGLINWALAAPASPTPVYWGIWSVANSDQAALQATVWGPRTRAPPFVG